MTTMPSKPGVTRKCHCFEPTNPPSWCDRPHRTPSVWAYRAEAFSRNVSYAHGAKGGRHTPICWCHSSFFCLFIVFIDAALRDVTTIQTSSRYSLFYGTLCVFAGRLYAGNPVSESLVLWSDARLRSEETLQSYKGLKEIYSKPTTSYGHNWKQNNESCPMKTYDYFVLGPWRWRGRLI